MEAPLRFVPYKSAFEGRGEFPFVVAKVSWGHAGRTEPALERTVRRGNLEVGIDFFSFAAYRGFRLSFSCFFDYSCFEAISDFAALIPPTLRSAGIEAFVLRAHLLLIVICLYLVSWKLGFAFQRAEVQKHIGLFGGK
jgi:hypothetical protein